MSTRIPTTLGLGLLAALSLPALSHAASITMDAGDTLGNSSFNSGLNWVGDAAPSAGNTYSTGNFTLRTPASGDSFTFGGDSLTINNSNGSSGGLLYKGTGTTGIITVNNLILAGGYIRHANGVGDIFQLAGNLSVTADSTIRAQQGVIDISAIISGSSKITVGAADGPGRILRFSGANTFTGNLAVENTGRFELTATGGLTFDIGANGVNNSVTGLNAAGSFADFNGTFNFDLTDAGTTVGDTWTIVDVANLTETFGGGFTVNGFTDAGGDLWTRSANGVTYQFSESSGTLSVTPVPEPNSAALALIGGAGLWLARRRQARA